MIAHVALSARRTIIPPPVLAWSTVLTCPEWHWGGQETVMMSKSRATGLSGRLQETERRHLTLVELLATIAVLGILAAIGTISTVAFTALGQQSAAASEKAMVQKAMDTMLADQGLEPSGACSNVQFQGGQAPDPRLITGQHSTRNMSRFPAQVPYRLPQSRQLVALYPHYLVQGTTRGYYHCVVPKIGGAATKPSRVQQDDYTSP
jgi:prepilin-type N-terminal cleavage/methylation domain-containing protein